MKRRPQPFSHHCVARSPFWRGAGPRPPPACLVSRPWSGCSALRCPINGMERRIAPAARALGRECHLRIGAEGGIPSRNPEELLEVFTLLTWASETLRERGHEISPDHRKALARIAPTLRALRHADGALARFHGGGRGQAGRLDAALAVAGVRKMPDASLAMGFARMSHGRTSILIDAAPPPATEASGRAHASTRWIRSDLGSPPDDRQLWLGRELWRKMAAGWPRDPQPFDPGD